jgi:hypothetical protein
LEEGNEIGREMYKKKVKIKRVQKKKVERIISIITLGVNSKHE